MKQSPLQKSTVKYLQIKAGLGKGEPKAIFFLAVGCFPDSFSSIETFLKAESSFLRCSFSSQGATVVPRQHDPDTAKASMNLIPKWGSQGAEPGKKRPLQSMHSHVEKQRQGGFSLSTFQTANSSSELLNR